MNWCGVFLVLLILPYYGVSATRWMVGGDSGWVNGVNFSDWSENITFLKNDRLIFVYYNTLENSVLEVNKSAYESCDSTFATNWTGGSGRDIVPLDETLCGPVSDPSKLPKLNYDGSSTGQAPGEDSEVIL
ncbi:hypothetical protein MKW94_021550, partial [Papaver nudicaule]|nr:hypothetical protein [Papaver nudicaule]